MPCTDALGTHEPAQPTVSGDPVSLAYLEGRRITRVDVAGRSSVPEQLIDDAIHTKAGAKIDRRTIQDDIRRLWRLEVFGDVRVVASKHRKGVALRYDLLPRPMVGRVMVAGVRRGVRGWRRIELLAGSIYDAARLHRYGRDQVRRYRRAGYLDAEVQVTERRGDAGRIDVCFAALPGPKYRIDRIDIVGNRALSDEAIREALAGGSDQFNVAGGVYDEARLTQRFVWVLAEYFEHGLVMAKLGAPRTTRDPRRGTIRVVVSITEGAVYRIGKVSFENASQKRHAYVRHLGISKGDVFRRSVLSRATEKLRVFEEKRGRKLATVFPLTEIDEKRHVIDIRFRFEERAP